MNNNSQDQHECKAHQSEAPVRQVAMSSPRITFPTTATIPPVPLPQQVAASRPHIPRIAALIARVSRPNKSLITAVQNKNPSKVCEILNDQTKAVWIDRKSLDLALCNVANQGHEQVVRLLLKKGADIDATGKYDAPALAGASRNGHEHIVRLLLEKGADINATGGYHCTALAGASGTGNEQIVRLLLEKGADINAGSWGKDTALVCTSREGHGQIVRLLLDKGADVDVIGCDGTALVWASGEGHVDFVQLMPRKASTSMLLRDMAAPH